METIPEAAAVSESGEFILQSHVLQIFSAYRVKQNPIEDEVGEIDRRKKAQKQQNPLKGFFFPQKQNAQSCQAEKMKGVIQKNIFIPETAVSRQIFDGKAIFRNDMPVKREYRQEEEQTFHSKKQKNISGSCYTCYLNGKCQNPQGICPAGAHDGEEVREFHSVKQHQGQQIDESRQGELSAPDGEAESPGKQDSG